MARYQLNIEGMSCGHCVRAVREALKVIPGVRVEDVSVGRAVVECEEARLPKKILTAIADEGFRVGDSSEI